jgi:hypothetical protein
MSGERMIAYECTRVFARRHETDVRIMYIEEEGDFLFLLADLSL